jgi:hypothetical protein
MKAYVLTTGVVFALLVAAHLWRMVAESPALARDPGYLAITLASGLLSLWAGRLLRRPPAP